jgi:hypothetical protein
MAFGKAVICGGAAAIWFYRAKKAQQMQKLVEFTVKSRQSTSPVQINVIPPPARTEQTQVIPPPEPPQNSHISAVVHSPQIAREPEEITKMICHECGKESSDEFNFCPHCGKALVPRPSVIESPSPSPEVQSVQNTSTDESELIKDGVAGTAIRVGTLVFGAFSAFSLLVSIIKGIVPIYLLEAAGWAGAAWYWQGKKSHSDVAKAIVIVLAVLVGIGEVVHIVSQAGSNSTAPTASNPFAAYGGHEVASAEASAASHVADVEKQAVELFSQKQYKEARPLFEHACNGTDDNGFKYAGFDGEMKACNYLGYLYAKGLGGTRDTEKARKVYQRACDQGTLSSCASLGSLFQDARDDDNARKYFQKACDGGLTAGCDMLRNVQ